MGKTRKRQKTKNQDKTCSKSLKQKALTLVGAFCFGSKTAENQKNIWCTISRNRWNKLTPESVAGFTSKTATGISQGNNKKMPLWNPPLNQQHRGVASK
jgi:hypothetical protein